MIMTAAKPSRISGGCEAILSTMSETAAIDLAGHVAGVDAATARPGPLTDDAPVFSHGAIFSPSVTDGQSRSAQGRPPLMRGPGSPVAPHDSAARVWAVRHRLPSHALWHRSRAAVGLHGDTRHPDVTSARPAASPGRSDDDLECGPGAGEDR